MWSYKSMKQYYMWSFSQHNVTGVLQTCICDHYASFCCIPNRIRRISNVQKYSFRNHSEENIQVLRNNLSNQLNIFDNLDEVNINEKFSILDSIIGKAYIKNCHVKTKTKATQKLSISSELLLLFACVLK